jgi:hypothetical protein
MDPIFGGILGGVGSLVGGLLGAGSKPKIPAFTPVDAAAEQSKAIQGNLANFDSASQLAAKTSSADQAALTEQLRKAIPGYDQIISKASQNIQSQLGGEINPDVSSQVQRSSAAKALAGGYGASSGLGRSLTARDLGLTSMGIQQQGFGNALNYIQNQRSTATAQPMSVSSMFLSPQQRIGTAQFNATGAMQQGNLQAQANAMPDPTLAALGNSFQQFGGLAAGYGFQSSLNNQAQQNMMSMYGGLNPYGYNSYANLSQNYTPNSFIPHDAGGS